MTGAASVPPSGLSRRRLLVAGASATVGLALGACTPAPAQQAAGPAPASFPPTFAWGVATSAYQVEGAVAEDGRGPSIWDTFAAIPGKIDDGSSGATACDHYHRWNTDLDLIKGLGASSYRFSVAWPRVLPDGRGTVNLKGLDFYRRLVDGLLARGITPVATLYHWDLPQALQDAGGWGVRDAAGWFADYATTVFGALDGVGTWLTINEAKIIVQHGYQLGWMAPGLIDRRLSGTVLHHLHLAHGAAVAAFRASGRPGRIGACPIVTPIRPADDTPDARRQAALLDATENGLYLDPILKGTYPSLDDQDPVFAEGLRSAQRDGDLATIHQPLDVLGLNYYAPAIVDGTGNQLRRFPTASNRWQQIDPNGLYEVLTQLHRDHGLPLLVCENGIPDRSDGQGTDDQERVDFLRGHLLAVHRAIADGADVLGYHAWSMMDNFEWARGYTQRWGLLRVDFTTQHRTPKRSAAWMTDVMHSGTVPLG